jgi:hypothetical protein
MHQLDCSAEQLCIQYGNTAPTDSTGLFLGWFLTVEQLVPAGSALLAGPARWHIT